MALADHQVLELTSEESALEDEHLACVAGAARIGLPECDQMARYSSVYPRVVSALEQLRRPASLGLLSKLAGALGIPNWILLRHRAPAAPLPASHALGRRYYIALDDAGQLRFRLPWLRVHRTLRAALTLEELAARTGIRVGVLDAYEKHLVGAPIHDVERLARALGVSQLELISE